MKEEVIHGPRNGVLFWIWQLLIVADYLLCPSMEEPDRIRTNFASRTLIKFWHDERR